MNNDINDIIKLACKICECDYGEFFSHSKRRHIADARCFVSKYLSEYMKISEISNVIDRHHASVTHLIKRHECLYCYDKIFKNKYDTFLKSLNDE